MSQEDQKTPPSPALDAVPLLKEIERQLAEWPTAPFSHDVVRGLLALVQQQREEIANEKVLRDEQRACEFHEEGDGSPCGECLVCLKDRLRACAAEKEGAVRALVDATSHDYHDALRLAHAYSGSTELKASVEVAERKLSVCEAALRDLKERVLAYDAAFNSGESCDGQYRDMVAEASLQPVQAEKEPSQ